MTFFGKIIQVISLFTAAIIAHLGGWDKALEILVILVISDYITGVLGAIIEKKLSSKIGAKGIAKKIALFVVVALAFQVDRYLNIDVLRTVAIGFYIANEGLSILENLAEMGVPFPQKLKDMLAQIRSENNSEGEES